MDDSFKFDPAIARALSGQSKLNIALGRNKEGIPLSSKADVSALTAGIKDSPEEIDKAATQFEALLMQQMFQSMWAGVGQAGMVSGSREEEFYRDMLNQALATDVAERQSIGIKAVIARDIAKLANKDQK